MNRIPSRGHQGGAALVVVLILLLVVTLLGLASLRGTLLEERMSANLYDRSLAFQAAESALREGELAVTGLAPLKNYPTATGAACSAGKCPTPVYTAGSKPRWLDPAFAGWQNAAAVTAGSVTITPQYVIEYMGTAPGWVGCDQVKPTDPKCLKPRFRITARTAPTGGSGLSQVILQSSFASP